MFGKLFCVDMKRGMFSLRFVMIVIASSLLLFTASWDVFWNAQRAWSGPGREIHYGAVDFLQHSMTFDVFKTVNVLLFSAVYAGSFCMDVKTRYVRMVLIRTDVWNYTISKFVSNLILILLAAVMACMLCCLAYMGLGYPAVSKDAGGGMLGAVYYKTIVRDYPFLYIVMTGLQFGAAAAMCSSVGLLYSVYQQNMFVCIGLSGFLFMLLLSFWWLNDTLFDVLNLVAMRPVLPAGDNTPYGLMFAWGMLWPMIVIAVCCILFGRRMEWRAKNGII